MTEADEFSKWVEQSYWNIPLLLFAIIVVLAVCALIFTCVLLIIRVNGLNDALAEHEETCEKHFSTLEKRSNRDLMNYVDKLTKKCVAKSVKKANVKNRSFSSVEDLGTRSHSSKSSRRSSKRRYAGHDSMIGNLFCFKRTPVHKAIELSGVEVKKEVSLHP